MSTTVGGLGDVGIYVADMDKMLDFYTRIMGLTITDGAEPDADRAYLSAQPERVHHEIQFVKNPERKTNAQQISWIVGTLDDLRDLFHDIRDYGCEFDSIVNHGIAFGCYFADPEGNRVEVYWPSGIDYPQPIAEPVDLDKTNEELLQILEDLKPLESPAPRYYGEDRGKRLAKTPSV